MRGFFRWKSCVENFAWMWVLERVWTKNSRFEHKNNVWVFFSLGPFPKRPLKVHIIHSKLGLFPLLHAPVTSSQYMVGWVWLLVDLGVCYVFVMNMSMFVYFKSCEKQPCIQNYVQVCVSLQVCYCKWGSWVKALTLIMFWLWFYVNKAM